MEVNDSKEERQVPSPDDKKKKGFTLPMSTLAMLKEKCNETGIGQSKVVDACLNFSLPHYTSDEFEGLLVANQEELREAVEKKVAAEREQQAVTEETATPGPQEIPKTHGRRPKLNVPGMNRRPRPKPPQEDLYRPNVGSRNVQSNPAPPVQAQPELNQGHLDYIVDRLANILGQQPAAPQQPSNNPQPQTAHQPQAAPRQQQQPARFAASYPPGYTGPPGVPPQPQAPAQQQPMYPPPQQVIQQDPFSMNIGQGQGQPITAQGILSGAQPMSPLPGGRNINMEMAKRALGENWRQNLRSLTAQSRREQ